MSLEVESPLDDTPHTIAETRSEYAEICLPNDTNMLGNMLGGHVMHLVDLCGAIAAMRHSRGAVVTASVDQMTFLHPIHIGEHNSSAYLTFVALDGAGNRVILPQVIPSTDEDRRRYEEAAERRAYRLARKAKAATKPIA
jgi:acyl-CoA hydrolase